MRLALTDYYENADVVFVAEIGTLSLTKNRGRTRATFTVAQTLKGEADFDHIITRSSSAACGYDLIEGKSYLVFASAKGRIGLCGGTGPLTQRLHYLKAIHRFQSGATDVLEAAWSSQLHDSKDRTACLLHKEAEQSSDGTFDLWQQISKPSHSGRPRSQIYITPPVGTKFTEIGATLSVGSFTAPLQDLRNLRHRSLDKLLESLVSENHLVAGPLVDLETLAYAGFVEISTDDLGAAAQRFRECSNRLSGAQRQVQH